MTNDSDEIKVKMMAEIQYDDDGCDIRVELLSTGTLYLQKGPEMLVIDNPDEFVERLKTLQKVVAHATGTRHEDS